MLRFNIATKTLASLSVLLLLAVTTFGQKEIQCRDLPEREFYLNLRLEAPARLTDFSGNTIYYSITTKNQVLAGLSIDVDDSTMFSYGFKKDYKKGLSQIVFCADTRQVIAVYRIGELSRTKFESKREMDDRKEKYQKRS